jgi:hypothetical protein
MPHLTTTTSRRPAATLSTLLIAAMVIACLGLAACGGSSSSSTSTAKAAGATTTGTPPAATKSTGTTPSGSHPARYRQLLALLTACMREHGINVPPPSASGKIDTKGIDTKSPQFKEVTRACILTLSKSGG